MPTILTSSQQTFVDITDQRKLSAYITSNLPKTQSEDPNVLPHTYAPSWATTHLVLTPVIFLDQTSIALDATGLTILWKRKDGASAETALTTGEAASAGILTVSQNKLAASGSGRYHRTPADFTGKAVRARVCLIISFFIHFPFVFPVHIVVFLSLVINVSLTRRGIFS